MPARRGARAVDVTTASRRCRRLWAVIRTIGLAYSLLVFFAALIVLVQVVSGHSQLLGEEGNALERMFDRDQLALLGAYVAAGPLLMLSVGRNSNAGVVTALGMLAVAIAMHAADTIVNTRIEDGDTAQNIMFALVLVATLLAAWYAVQTGRHALGGGFSSALRVGTEFARAVARRRQSYRTLRWSRSWLLAAAVLAVPLAWIALSYLGTAVLVYGLGVPVAVFDVRKDQTEIYANLAVWMIVAIIAVEIARFGGAAILGFVLWRAAWRRVRLSAEEVVGTSAYRPLVFLRSFQDEDATVRPKGLLRWLIRREPRLEEVLVGKVSRLGPAVAIGLPGEQLPRLGALRAYYSDEEWKPAVLGWIGRAHMIFVVGGTSPWALWELTHILTQGLSGSLVLVIPPDASEEARRQRWDSLCHAASTSRWHHDMLSVNPRRLLAVVFDADGRLLVIRGSDRHQVDYELAVQVATLRLARDPAAPE